MANALLEYRTGLLKKCFSITFFYHETYEHTKQSTVPAVALEFGVEL